MQSDIAALIESISGSDCRDTINPELAAGIASLAKRMWGGIVATAMAVDGESFINGIPTSPLLDSPEVVVVRTPRGYPYSFADPDGATIVVDEHLHRITHRWGRLAKAAKDGITESGPHFEELFAERFYLIGNFKMATACMAEVTLSGDSSDFRPFEGEAEQAFLRRSYAQLSFMVGHELAHIFLKRAPQEWLYWLRRKVNKVLGRGVEIVRSTESDELRAEGERLLNLLRESETLSEETLCDSLSISAAANCGLSWDESLVGAFDALGILEMLNSVDLICRLHTHRDERRFVEDDTPNFKAIRDAYQARTSVVGYIYKAVQFQLMDWGQSKLAVGGGRSISVASAGRYSLIESILKHEPAKKFILRWNQAVAGERPFDHIDAFVMKGHASRTVARKAIGFGERVGAGRKTEEFLASHSTHE